MLVVSPDLAVAIEHVKDKCKIRRLDRYMNGKGKPIHPMITKVLEELSKEEIVEALFYGYKIR